MTYPYRPAYAELEPPTYKDEATGASVTVAPRARWEGEEWAFLGGWLDTSHWTEGPARVALLWTGARPDELTTAYDDDGQVERQCWRCGRWSDAVQLNVVDVWVCSRLHGAATCRSKPRGGDS